MNLDTAAQIDLHEYVGFLVSQNRITESTVDLYRRSLAACDLNTIDKADPDSTWSYLLDRFSSGKSAKTFVDTARSIATAALNLDSIEWKRNKTYKTLVFELAKAKGTPREEYSDEQIQLILGCARKQSPRLFSACVLMSLSGLRVSACKGLMFEDFKKVEGVPDVRIFGVTSKGSTYHAAISEYGYHLLDQTRWKDQSEVIPYDSGYTTAFGTSMRMKLRYMLAKHGLTELEFIDDDGITKRKFMDGKSICHSMRHWAITQMASTLHSEDVSLLAGHMVSSKIAYRFYVSKMKGKITPNYAKRIAEAYKATPLFSWRMKGDK